MTRMFSRISLSIVVAFCATGIQPTLAQEKAREGTDALPTLRVAAQIPVGIQPTSIVVSADSQFVYVGNWGDSTVSVIRAGANTVTNTISSVTCPQSVAVSADGSTLYVANNCLNQLAVIDTASGSLTGNITVGNAPWSLAMSPVVKNQQLYVSNSSDGTISVINTVTNQVVGAPIKVGGFPQELLFKPGGKSLYLYDANPPNYGLIKINVPTKTFKRIGNQQLTQKALSITPDGSKLYSISLATNSIVCLDTASNTVVAEVAAPSNTNLNTTAMSRNGGILYVTVANELKAQGLLYMFNTTTNQFVGKPVPFDHNYANAVAMAPDGKTLYTADSAENTVTVISIGSL